MMKRFLYIIFLLAFALSDYAQIVKVDYLNGKKGFIDAAGNWIVPPIYEYAKWDSENNWGEFSDDNIRVRIEDRSYGLVDKNGKVVFPYGIYHYFYLIKDYDYIEVTDLKNKKGVATRNGQFIIPCKYKSIKFYLDEDKKISPLIEVVSSESKYGVFTSDGKEYIPMVYDYIEKAGDGIFIVNKGGNVIEENYVYSVKGGTYGYFAAGKEIIPCIYDEASIFTNGVATVKKDGIVELIKNPLEDGSKILIANNSQNIEVIKDAEDKKQGSKKKSPVVSRFPAPSSDVDKNIPTGKKQENLFAFIIANENYPDATVPYALNDGRIFKEYCSKTLGIPDTNINLYEDATFGNIITAVEKLKNIADAYDGEASVIFYYAGHGIPDEKNNSAYLLPVDGSASDITTTGYSLAKLYKEMSSLKLKSSLLFLDACFSGAKREDQMLSQARGVAIKVKEEVPQGNMVVFSAAQGDETAHQLEEKGHGLFTYFLLKELQATKGNVTLGSLAEYVTKQVSRQSVVINNKRQTPTVIPSATLANGWQNMYIK